MVKMTDQCDCFLILNKKEHKYIFKYSSENMKNLFFSLLEFARSEEHCITRFEIFGVIRKIASKMRIEGKIKIIQFDL